MQTNTNPGGNVNVPDLDQLLTLKECSAWLRLNERDLSEKSRGRRAVVPAVRLNRKVLRFHPRTILAKFASEAGLSPELIGAAFGRGGEGR